MLSWWCISEAWFLVHRCVRFSQDTCLCVVSKWIPAMKRCSCKHLTLFFFSICYRFKRWDLKINSYLKKKRKKNEQNFHFHSVLLLTFELILLDGLVNMLFFELFFCCTSCYWKMFGDNAFPSDEDNAFPSVCFARAVALNTRMGCECEDRRM